MRRKLWISQLTVVKLATACITAGSVRKKPGSSNCKPTIRILAPTDHLLCLLCHAYKHFLYAGFGIRHVCDIGIFAEPDLERATCWRTS